MFNLKPISIMFLVFSLFATNVFASATQQFQYDAVGNVTNNSKHQFIYGLDGNLQKVLDQQGHEIAHYIYDGNNHRIKIVKGAESTIDVYSKSGTLLYEETPSKNSHSNYYYLNGSKVAEDTVVNNKSTVTYFHNDLLSSPIVASNAAAEVLWQQHYFPYGERIEQNSGNQHWYTGKPQDKDTGLQYFGARYYDPAIGRFMSVDPVGFTQGSVFSFNRYAYANDNPYSYVDHDGQLPDLVEQVIGTVDGTIQGALMAPSGHRLAGAFLGAGVGFASSLLTAADTPAAVAAAEGTMWGAYRVKGVSATIDAVKTPYGLAKQSYSAEMLSLRSEVLNGKGLFRAGKFGRQHTGSAQFWSPENPINVAEYANKYGMAGPNNFNWVMKARIIKGASPIAREAPALGGNVGGAAEIVTSPNSVKIEWFHMP